MHTSTRKHSERILEQVKEQLKKGRLVENLAGQQAGPNKEVVTQLVHRQQLTQLDKVLDLLHAADVAWVMENLSHDDRLLVWERQVSNRGGQILLELADSVAEQVLEDSGSAAVEHALRQLDAEDLSYLTDIIPEAMLQQRLDALTNEEQAWVSQSREYADDSVGALMGKDMIVVRDDQSLKAVLKDLRGLDEIPEQNDKLFVVDRRGHLVGVLPWQSLVLNAPKQLVSEVMARDVVTFEPGEKASNAARAFERYDLVSAPVVSSRGRPIGRLTVDEVIDFVRDEISEDALNSAGINSEEDLFAPVWHSARNRWLWLSLSLLTVFFASRVIGMFEETIAKFVALAALMPIVAAIGGNTGNQTTTLVVRGLALMQIDSSNIRHLIRKELTLSVLNGLVWGSVVGLFAYVFYQDINLMFIIAVAMMITLLLAAVLGLAIPLTLQSMKRDPALGSGVLVTALTDSMGFFIFLGLAAMFL